MALPEGVVKNFEVLRQAFKNGDVALLECSRKADGSLIPVICAVNRPKDGSMELVPFAEMFMVNPYDLLIPPNPEEKDDSGDSSETSTVQSGDGAQ